jgi:NADPH2:quinone reductase
MRAVQVVRLEGPSAVEVAEVADPVPGDGQVLVEVHAAGVTYPDVLLTRGRYQLKPEPPFTPGSEVAGVVLSAPSGASVRVGDRVAAFPGFGGFAELVTVDPAAVFRLPAQVSQDGPKMPAGPLSGTTNATSSASRGIGHLPGDHLP